MTSSFGSKNKPAVGTTQPKAAAVPAPTATKAAAQTAPAAPNGAAGLRGAARSLIIVESPSKAKTIGKYLGPGYKVVATVGHLRDLILNPKDTKDSKCGVNLSTWEGEFEWSPSKERPIRDIQKEAGAADAVFIATDPDREGEVIAAEVSELLAGKSGVRRAVWGEITQKAVLAGLAASREVDQPKVDAGLARRMLDRLIGFLWSRYIAKKLGRKGVTAGRVQSVAARLIVDRDRAIKQFVPTAFGGAKLVAEADGKPFEAELTKVGGLQVVNPDQEGKPGTKVLSPAEAAALRLPKRGEKLTVLSMETKPTRRGPKPPFTMSAMAVDAAKRLGLDTKRTMDVAQVLYTEGLITYHRSDSPNVGEEAQAMGRAYIAQKYGDKYLPKAPKQYEAKGDHAQEAHECIRPSHLEAAFAKDHAEHMANAVASVGKDAESLYELILNRFVACQRADKQIDATVAQLQFGAGAAALVFRASGNMTSFDGWEKAYAEDTEEDGEDSPKKKGKVVVLPLMVKGAQIPVNSSESTTKKTRPPAHFTEATMNEELEERGLSRPSTLATLYAILQDRQYVTKTNEGSRKDVLKSTELAGVVVDTLVAKFPKMMDYDATARMEDDLAKIATGKLDQKAFMAAFWKDFSAQLATQL